MKLARVLILGAAAMSCGVTAQAQDATQRRDELMQVVERINDPDPFMRIAYLEEIVAEDDQLKTELAIQTAMGIDDARLRAQATKAYLRAVRDITFEWELPEKLASAVQGRNANLAADESNLIARHAFRSGLVPIRISSISESSSFEVAEYGAIRDAVEGRIVGQRLLFRANTYLERSSYWACNFEFEPTAAMVLEGEMRCENFGWSQPMRISAPMF